MVMRAIMAAAVLTGVALPVAAQSLSVELNAADNTQDACRLSFLAENTLGADLSAVVFEVVILNPQGKVHRMTLLDFQDLPQARKRVRQFDLPGLGCDAVAQLLINAAATCTGQSLAPDACMKGLADTSRLPNMGISG